MLTRVHFRLLSSCVLSLPYRACLKLFVHLQALRAVTRFILDWRPFPTRIFYWISKNDSTVNTDTDLPSPLPRALIHVAFHFNYARLGYVREVIRSLLKGPYSNLDLIVDTNTNQTERWLSGVDNRVKFRVHDSLGHPFLLTWACRDDFRDRLDDFDLFIYAEDDMLITPSAVAAWLRHRVRLSRQRSYVGFVRVETERSGRLVASDFQKRAPTGAVVHIAGYPYLSTEYPYQACWIYDRQLMEEFVASSLFEPPPASAAETEDVRAIAALGLTFHDRGPGWPARSLIPLTSTHGIAPDCLVYHLPCNYGRRIGRQVGDLATIPIEELLDHSTTGPARPTGRGTNLI